MEQVQNNTTGVNVGAPIALLAEEDDDISNLTDTSGPAVASTPSAAPVESTPEPVSTPPPTPAPALVAASEAPSPPTASKRFTVGQ